MNTVKTTYVNALLADASYVTLRNGDGIITEQSELRSSLAASLTQPQAEFLLLNFDILTQTLSPSGGFDAVVWRGKSGTDYAGQVYVSLRGTQGAQDILDDVSLASRGVPYEQLRDMANWWMRATAKPGELVRQIKVDTIAHSPLANIYTFSADISAVATGELYGQVNTSPASMATVSGATSPPLSRGCSAPRSRQSTPSTVQASATLRAATSALSSTTSKPCWAARRWARAALMRQASSRPTSGPAMA
ncbi:hypothetical protein HBH1_00882 [Herbaspirillum sp. BH-1]|nr:hypothetical protein HBH1_00882 [Herbaspirillum sp. BH-1]